MPIIRILDVETTGLAPPEGAVVEAAYCDLHADPSVGGKLDWQVHGGTAWFCNPGHPIPPESSAIHHIVNEDVSGAEPFATIAARLAQPPEGEDIAAFAAHNDRFDRQWLTNDLIGGRWIDTYRCALRLWPDAPAHSLQALRYWRRPEGLDRSKADSHRVYGDAYVAAHILREMLTLASGKQLVAWSTGPALLPRFTFGKHAMKPIADVDASYLEWMLKQDFDEDVLFTARAELERGQAAVAA